MFRENVRGHLRWFEKHRGAERGGSGAAVFRASLRLRGLVFRGERGRMYRDAARSL